jgi:phage protein D
MTAVKLSELSTQYGAFYAPQFEVRIHGVGLPRDVLRDVVDITYHDSIKEFDGFELTVNNWDSAAAAFKYLGSETDQTLENAPDSSRYRLFEPSAKDIEIWMGYVDGLELMMTGSITTLEPQFPNGGMPIIKVRGLNVLHRLRTRPYSNTWKDKKDSEVAKALSKLTDKKTHRKRFPLPIKTDSDAERVEPQVEQITQQNQFDIDFLFQRAQERGYVVAWRPKTKREDEHLYFGPSSERAQQRSSTYELAWGRTLIDFTPSLNTTAQVGSVTVTGWNRRTKARIEEKVTLDDEGITVNRNLLRLVKWDHREDVRASEPVFTPQQARDRARAILLEKVKGMVMATGNTVGIPGLRAGQLVRIAEVGARLSGLYYVTETSHTVNASGYRVRFTARREDPGKQGGSS